MKRYFSLVSSLLLLAGCAQGPQASSLGGTLILRPEVVSGEARLQAASPYYLKEDIGRLMVKLYTVADGVETPVVVNGEPLVKVFDTPNPTEGEVVFANLKANTTYRAKCEAYLVTGQQFTLISTSDARSYTDIVLTNDDRPTVASLSVKLGAKPFSGETGFGFTLTPGILIPEASESLTTVEVIS